ncbi:MAG: hypothetical protein HW421_3731 [Ignavibacteria bacterium]|nr:hypothetical protein [Ignavibacteria bacterium]
MQTELINPDFIHDGKYFNCYGTYNQPKYIIDYLMKLTCKAKSPIPAIIPGFFPKTDARSLYIGKTRFERGDLMVIIGKKGEVAFAEHLKDRFTADIEKRILFVEIEENNVNWNFKNMKPEFANFEILNNKLERKMKSSTKLIIPTTKLRNFYTSLSELRLRTETQLCIAEDINRNDNYNQLITFYEESRRHFEKYDNKSEKFLSEAPRKKSFQGKISITRTQDVISLFENSNNLITIENDSNYNFEYIAREVSTIRTTKAEFDTGESGKSSGLGGIDFIGWNQTKNLPIIGEIKLGNDKNPFYAIIQLLTYLSELTTPNQIQRIINTELFGKNFLVNKESSFYLYLVLSDLSIKQNEILKAAKDIAQHLKKPNISDIEEIVFFKIDPNSNVISKT